MFDNLHLAAMCGTELHPTVHDLPRKIQMREMLDLFLGLFPSLNDVSSSPMGRAQRELTKPGLKIAVGFSFCILGSKYSTFY